MSSWFWSSTPKPAPISTETANENRMEKIRVRRAAMQRRHATIRVQIADATERAHAAGATGNRNAAVIILKERKARENELANVASMIRGLDQQVAAIEQASISASMAETVRDSAAIMASVHSTLDPVAVERDIIDMRIKSREANYVTRLMTRPLNDVAAANTDDDADHDYDDDLDSEMAAELASIMAISTLNESAPTPPTTLPTSTMTTVDLNALENDLSL